MSLRKAIDNFCKECIYDPNVKGSIVAQVRECGSKLCPLYSVRPTVQFRGDDYKGRKE